jgi:hypothetical protein
MIRFPVKHGLQSTLLLASLLVGAQCAALAHAYGHDVGAIQGQPCPTCITAGQLGHACVDAPAIIEIGQNNGKPPAESAAPCASLHTVAARQRGPPNSP